MITSAIVAVSENNVIGKNNDLPWHMPTDLRYFMRTTKNHHIIMGRKNFESLRSPLKNRVNIVMTRDPFFNATNVLVVHDLNEALKICEKNGEEEAFIIGGAQIYELAMPYIDRLYLTRIHAKVEGDVFFPKFNEEDFDLISKVENKSDEKNPYDFTYFVYQKKSDK